ncbi:aldo/keto reductase [Hamadaea sp. NPDC050747]|uniref:aldo/keto reductase n=1 Tax=Hamadaea sp. NPDC050747 TaxID=3155789 RepID=UPI0033F71B40
MNADRRGLACRPLGRTGIKVTELGLGGAPLSGRFGDVPVERVYEVLDTALETGIGLVDTAARYAGGRAESDIGGYFAKSGWGSVVISTKVVPHTAGPGAVRAGVEASMSRLGRTHLEIVLLHDPYGLPTPELAANIQALQDLQAEGLIGAVGVGIGDVPTLEHAVADLGVDCVLLSARYTLLDQTAAGGLLPLCRERGTGVILGSVFNSGILATGDRPGARFHYDQHVPADVLDRVRRAQRSCDRHGVVLAAAALQFALAHPAVSSVLIGTTEPRHLARNVAVATTPIPAAFWADLVADGVLPGDAIIPGDAG